MEKEPLNGYLII